MQKTQTFAQSPTILTPEAFPPLGQVILSPLDKSTPAKQIMRINRQGGLAGVRLSGKFSPYTFADVLERVELCDFLKHVATDCSDPWLWLGDFNIVLSPIERLGGQTTEVEMEQFQDCASLCCMDDISATGALYTWSNKQVASTRVYSRLDRVMGNLEWMAMFGDYIAHFHPEGLFDHCPCTVERFPGTKMFGVVKKLKALKPVLKKLNSTCFSDIENATAIASLALANIQQALVDNPRDLNLIQQELDLARDLKELTVARDSFLSQKAKVQWSDIQMALY
ncbi:uncharacterized protein LOC141618659 [Silene latifolia]|uniref:uncharacterized protein LOC141618659 n=1 Tax=Silene latifolia TaxID=37657 RepID=UPI003D77ABD3